MAGLLIGVPGRRTAVQDVRVAVEDALDIQGKHPFQRARRCGQQHEAEHVPLAEFVPVVLEFVRSKNARRVDLGVAQPQAQRGFGGDEPGWIAAVRELPGEAHVDNGRLGENEGVLHVNDGTARRVE